MVAIDELGEGALVAGAQRRQQGGLASVPCSHARAHGPQSPSRAPTLHAPRPRVAGQRAECPRIGTVDLRMTSIDTREAAPSEQADDGSFRRRECALPRLRQRRRQLRATAPSAGRYHLYVSLGLPVGAPHDHLPAPQGPRGRGLDDRRRPGARRARLGDHRRRGTTPDPVNDFTFLSEAYVVSDTDFDGHVTVPVLWDRKRGRIVNNESSEIIRMFDREFDAFAEHPELHYLPDELRARDRRDQRVRLRERQRRRLPHGLRAHAGRLRALLRHGSSMRSTSSTRASRRAATCSATTITEADWRLFTTLLRFDPVYVGHFKCNLRRVSTTRSSRATCAICTSSPGIAATVDMDHIKRHYYRTHPLAQPAADRARRPGARPRPRRTAGARAGTSTAASSPRRSGRAPTPSRGRPTGVLRRRRRPHDGARARRAACRCATSDS